MTIPERYKWLLSEKSPKILIEALKHYGVTEVIGPGNNPEIISWADEIGHKILGIKYTSDEIPWCGLFMALCAMRCGYTPPPISVRAKAWLGFGELQKVPMLGDVLVFVREGGGHVGLYVGEDEKCYHVLGANQKNSVCIVPIDKKRMIGCRRPAFKIGKPGNIRRVHLAPTGELSHNEA